MKDERRTVHTPNKLETPTGRPSEGGYEAKEIEEEEDRR